MRLIDADGVKDSLLTELLMGVDGGTDDSWLKAYEVINRIENIVNEWVDNQPTVKAIPIEWIEKFMNRFRLGMVTSDEYALLHFMLTEWEVENEQTTGPTRRGKYPLGEQGTGHPGATAEATGCGSKD